MSILNTLVLITSWGIESYSWFWSHIYWACSHFPLSSLYTCPFISDLLYLFYVRHLSNIAPPGLRFWSLHIEYRTVWLQKLFLSGTFLPLASEPLELHKPTAGSASDGLDCVAHDAIIFGINWNHEDDHVTLAPPFNKKKWSCNCFGTALQLQICTSESWIVVEEFKPKK